MISFRTKSEAGASVAIIIALLTLVGTGAFMAFVKPPTTAGLVAQKTRSRDEVHTQVEDLKVTKAKLTAEIASRIWTLPSDQIGPKALEMVTAAAVSEKLRLIAFRPQKATEVNGLNQLPFLIAIEGSYPNLMRFLSDIQKPELKLGTGTVQIANSDPNTDLVTATIGVVAYRELDIKKATNEKANGKEKN